MKIGHKYNIPVLIPSYEPTEHLPAVCRELISAGVKDIIVLDDGSGEEYRHFFDEVEQLHGCTVLRHKKNLGKGKALKDMFAYVSENRTDIIGCITADSDGQHLTKDIIACAEALSAHPDDLILGCRDFDLPGIPPKSLFGNRLTKKMFRLTAGLELSDTQTGLRGIPLTYMKELIGISGNRFEFETNMLLESKGRLDITEVPITTVYEDDNRHTHFSPIVDSVRIYFLFFRCILRFSLSSLLSFVIDILLFNLFCILLKGWSLELYIAVSTVCARVISSVCNYLINHKLVFRSREKILVSSLKYFLLAAVIMLLSALFTTLGANMLGHNHEVIVKMVVDTTLFFLSYFVQKRLIFRSDKTKNK